MSNPIINIDLGDNDLGKLVEPATVLINRVFDSIGIAFESTQIERIAKAEAKADKIKAVSKIEIDELAGRASKRVQFEEARNQKNIEKIVRDTLSFVESTAKPESIEEDWIINFFDKCRLTSDKDMQLLWSKILSGESNMPGSFSKRTVNFMASLDKNDAMLFMILCSFNWKIDGNIYSLIFDYKEEIYNSKGINFDSLKHLDSIGLISFDFDGYLEDKLSRKIIALYQNNKLMLEFFRGKNNDLQIGQVLLTNIGKELSNICNPEKVDDFDIYVIGQWFRDRITISSVIPK